MSTALTMTDVIGRLESVTTVGLAEGDIVWSAGARLLLGERHEWPDEWGPVVQLRGTLLNPDADGIDPWVRGWIDRDGCWPIQGNRLATWAREVPTCE